VLDAAIYAWVAIGALWLAGLPFALNGERAAVRVGLSNQSLRGWFIDQAKGLAISAVVAPPALWGVVAALREWPHGWWLPVTIGSIGVELLFTVIAPVVIVPMFMRSHPLPEGPLADDLHELADRAGVQVHALRVLEASAKMSASNAFVAGIGPTRRIVLFDNLLGDDPDTERQIAETRSVLAHEFGHHAKGDLWRMAAASAAATALALAAVALALLHLPDTLAHRSAGAFAELPALFVCAALAQIVTSVALGAYSRRRERAADAYGVRLIGDGEPFARALESLVATNLSELRPPRFEQWLGASHPPPYQRIARARSQGKENPTPGANGAL
jgi:STE24 endopeptidase